VNNKFQLILIVIHTVVSHIKPLVTFSSWEEQKFLAIKYISLSILINRIVINIISKVGVYAMFCSENRNVQELYIFLHAHCIHLVFA